ncbi:MAG: hypothetical protein ACRDKF_01830 [Actinomycetota bacterium]
MIREPANLLVRQLASQHAGQQRIRLTVREPKLGGAKLVHASSNASAPNTEGRIGATRDDDLRCCGKIIEQKDRQFVAVDILDVMVVVQDEDDAARRFA